MKEIYKDIQGYEGRYQVSNLGNVISFKRGIQLKPDNQNGYLRVSLCKDGVATRFLIHRLVAQAFIPNKDNKPHINHIDNNPSNNNVSNLEWCTHSENMLHAHKQGRLANIKASQAAVAPNRIRYAQIYADRLGDRFVAYHASDRVQLEGRKKSISAVTYICGSCEIERTTLVSSLEITRHNGVCLNCQNIIKLVDEDIV